MLTLAAKKIETSPLNHAFSDLAFRWDVNGLRALAVASVVAFHVDRRFVPGGFVGVDIFFVISGYLISRIILVELSAHEFSLADFYAKRVKRIFPALALVLMSVWAAGWLLLDPPAFRALGIHQIDGAFYILNFRLMAENGYFDSASEAKPLLHLWSLSIEEQFYVVWPLLLIALFRARRLVASAIFLIFMASLSFNLYMTPRDPTQAFYLPWSRAWELALGAGVAYRELFRPVAFRPWARDVASLTGFTVMIAAIFLLDEAQPFPGWRALVPTLGCALVLAHPGGAWSGKFLSARPAQWLGLISYPLYLWHWPLLSYAYLRYGGAAPLALRLALAGCAIVLAVVTYRLLERPVSARFRQNRWMVTATLVGALVACGLIGMLTRALKGFPSRYPPQVAAIFDFPRSGFRERIYRAGSCFDDNRDDRVDAESITQRFAAAACDTPKDPNKPTILLLGDSHGAHLYTGLKTVFEEKANILQINASYCVPLVEHVNTNAGLAGTERCKTINDYIFARVRALKPDVIVVGAYFNVHINDAAWFYPDFVEKFRAGAASLHEAGAGAIVVAGQIPTWTQSLPFLAANEMLAEGATPMVTTRSLDQQSLALDVVLQREPWPDGVSYVSLVKGLCNDSGCKRRIGDDLPDDLMAIDYGHFSQRGSTMVVRDLLGPTIENALNGPK